MSLHFAEFCVILWYEADNVVHEEAKKAELLSTRFSEVFLTSRTYLKAQISDIPEKVNGSDLGAIQDNG